MTSNDTINGKTETLVKAYCLQQTAVTMAAVNAQQGRASTVKAPLTTRGRIALLSAEMERDRLRKMLDEIAAALAEKDLFLSLDGRVVTVMKAQTQLPRGAMPLQYEPEPVDPDQTTGATRFRP